MNYRELYKGMFARANYSLHSHHEPRYVEAVEFARNKPIKTAVDISSGRGAFLQAFQAAFPDVILASTDIDKFHSEAVAFMELDLSNPQQLTEFFSINKFDYLTCLDVLEHIEEEATEHIIASFAKGCKYALLSIARTTEVHGDIDLHINRKDKEWWDKPLSRYFKIEYFKELYEGNVLVYGLINETN